MCIEKSVESGDMSELEAKATVVEDKGVAAGGSNEPADTPDEQDKDLESDPENGHWKGNVFWIKLEGAASNVEA